MPHVIGQRLVCQGFVGVGHWYLQVKNSALDVIWLGYTLYPIWINWNNKLELKVVKFLKASFLSALALAPIFSNQAVDASQCGLPTTCTNLKNVAMFFEFGINFSRYVRIFNGSKQKSQNRKFLRRSLQVWSDWFFKFFPQWISLLEVFWGTQDN